MFATPGQLKILNQSMNSEKTERKFENQQGESSDSRDFVKIQKNLLLAGDCPCPFNPFHGYCLHEAATPECLASGRMEQEDERMSTLHDPWGHLPYSVMPSSSSMALLFETKGFLKKDKFLANICKWWSLYNFFFIQMGFFFMANVTNLIKWLQQLIKHY